MSDMKDVFAEDGAFEDQPKEIFQGGDDAKSRLTDLVMRQIELEDEVADITERLDRANKELTAVRTNLIPDLMKELGFSKIVSKDGDILEIKRVVQASLPKEDDRKNAALKWLREIGEGDVIKNEVTAVFGKGEDEFANHIYELLRGNGADPQRKISVHPMTLSALIRRLREEGKPVDEKNLTLYEGEVSKIKRGADLKKSSTRRKTSSQKTSAKAPFDYPSVPETW